MIKEINHDKFSKKEAIGFENETKYKIEKEPSFDEAEKGRNIEIIVTFEE